MLKINDKGSLADVIYIGVVLTVFAGLVLMGGVIVGNFNTQVQGMDVFPAASKDNLNVINNQFTGVLDNSMLFLFGVMCVGTLALAFMVRIHPVFFIFYVLSLVIVIVGAAIMSNTYEKMATDPSTIAFAEQLTFVPLVMTYLPIMLGVFGTIVGIIMYKGWADQNA